MGLRYRMGRIAWRWVVAHHLGLGDIRCLLRRAMYRDLLCWQDEKGQVHTDLLRFFLG